MQGLTPFENFQGVWWLQCDRCRNRKWPARRVEAALLHVESQHGEVVHILTEIEDFLMGPHG